MPVKRAMFFEELNERIRKVFNNYENVIHRSDLNIDLNRISFGKGRLKNPCELHSLSKLFH